MVSFALCPLYLLGRTPLNRRLDEPQSQSGCFGEEKNLLSAEIRTVGCPASSLVTELTVPSRLQMFASNFLVNFENHFSFRGTEITEVKRMCPATATFGTTVF